ncbi:type VII secretion-associated serine protease mycosin, partial [Streptomyces albidoflavus]
RALGVPAVATCLALLPTVAHADGIRAQQWGLDGAWGGLRLRLPWHGTTTRHAPRTPHEPGTGDAPGAQQGDRDDDG